LLRLPLLLDVGKNTFRSSLTLSIAPKKAVSAGLGVDAPKLGVNVKSSEQNSSTPFT
jgi:hypothetical protein